MELDRAFVVNGSDLRIVLAGDGGAPPLVPNPRDVAAYILGAIGEPLDTHRGGGTWVTRERLETALAEFCHVAPGGGVAFSGDSGTVADVARALHGQLTAFNAAQEDLERHDPWAEPPAPVHACCEHAPVSLASGELAVMDKVTALLRPHSQRGRRRVLRWALDYLLDDNEPPF